MKIKSLVVSMAIAGLSFGASASTASFNLVANGDFESRSFEGWTMGGNTNFNDFAYFDDGKGYFWRNGAMSTLTDLSQSLSTIAGKSYTLSFDLRSDSSGSNAFVVTFGNSVVFSSSNFGQPWVTYSIGNLVANSNSTLLKVSSRNDPSFNYIDNIRVAETVAPVPEPETYAMLLAGLGLIGMTLRRRRLGNYR